jgi:hypothetical protein
LGQALSSATGNKVFKNASIIFVTKCLEYRSFGEAYSCSADGKIPCVQ